MTTSVRAALDRLADAFDARLAEVERQIPKALPTTWLKVEQVAEYLGCSEQHVRELCREGKLPCMRADPSSRRSRWRIDATKLPDAL